MNPETLLGLISGGRYQTSADLPTIPEMAHSYIDQIKDTHDQQQQREMQIQGQGLGLLDMVGGFSKAGAMIPTGTEKFQQLIKMLGRSKGDEILYNNQLLKALKELQTHPSTLGSGFVKKSTLANIKNIRKGMK
jgi:hypothetical protein